MTRLLHSAAALRERAFAHQGDTNEAYLMVHHAMAGAGDRSVADADLALTRAIAAQAHAAAGQI
jgi:hypothetical protein